MPRTRIANMHGFTVQQLARLAAEAESPYSRRDLQTALMTANSIPAKVVAKTLGCCRATVYMCIRIWNEHVPGKEPRNTEAVALGVSQTRC